MGNTNDRNAGGVVAGFVYQIYYTPAVLLVNCKDNQKRADTNTSASPNLLMGLQCLADSNSFN